MSTPITNIPGIGPSTAIILSEHGFKSAEDIATSNVKALNAVSGFGPIRAKTCIAAAKSLTPANKSAAKKPKKSKSIDSLKKKSKPKKKDKAKAKKSAKSKKGSKAAKSGKKNKIKKPGKKAKAKKTAKKRKSKDNSKKSKKKKK